MSISELLKIADPVSFIYDDYINNFDSALKWIKDNEVIRHHLGNEYDNDQKMVGSFSGWRSPTSSSQHGNPECWSTALVFDCLHMPPKVEMVFIKKLAESFTKGQPYAKRIGLTLFRNQVHERLKDFHHHQMDHHDHHQQE